jgi:hypothetical protein
VMSGKHARRVRRLAVSATIAQALASMAPLALAQHASDNPVVSADDAFGLTLGLESTGIYNPGCVRGFNPQAAGNVRVDGLYFDQQGELSNRVIESSTIRVGAPATLRLVGGNLTNFYFWNIAFSPGFFEFAPRTALAYLTVDLGT